MGIKTKNNNNHNLIDLLSSTTAKDRSIDACLLRYLKSIAAHSIDRRFSMEQLGQLLTRPGHILLLQKHQKPTEHSFNEKDLDLFLMKHFVIHCLATDGLQRTSINTTRIEASAKFLLGLLKNYQGSIEENTGVLLDIMSQENFKRKKHLLSSHTTEGTYVPSLREHFASAYCENQQTGDQTLVKQIQELGNEQKAVILLNQFDIDRQQYGLVVTSPLLLVKAQ